MKPKLHWGILATGHIAGIFAEGLRKSKTGKLVAVGSRALASAQKFAKRHGASRFYGSYEELLRDPLVEAVYIAIPHPSHLKWVLAAAKAGKHILCEKPLTMNYRDTRRAVEAAKKQKVFLMEAFMYRCHPQTAKLVQLIRRKIIGEVRLIQASFCFDAKFDLKHRLFNKKLGGGAILDVGCYPVSMARLLAGAALRKPFAEPLEVKGTGVVGEKSGVDEVAIASLKFPNGILAELSCGVRGLWDRSVMVYGSKGTLSVTSPWAATRKPGTSFILFHPKAGGKIKKFPVHSSQQLPVWEADETAQRVFRGDRESPAMSWADSLGNSKTLDLWRACLGR